MGASLPGLTLRRTIIANAFVPFRTEKDRACRDDLEIRYFTGSFV